MTTRVLYGASEALPFAKTGGLADVAHALPAALAREGLDVRVATPAYRGAREQLADARRLATLTVRGQVFTIWEGAGETPSLRIWLVDCPPLFDRPGTPYTDAAGHEHADNAWRFGCFGEALAQLGLGAAGWQPDVLHLNDWQTGLAPAWLRERGDRPRTVFTIHNLAYQGVFPRHEFDALGVPAALWHHQALEFYGMGSFLKGGLVFADTLTTVSPTYAQQIQMPEFGHGLDGLLRHRSECLAGILNGIDDLAWDPARDPHLVRTYDAATVATGKAANKRALAKELGLADGGDAALVGVVSRLAHQKGINQIVAALPALLRLPIQLVVLGSGEPALVRALLDAAAANPTRIAVHIGYDERLAHRIEAAADLFLMPSRYEPCGLNQMYSQRYGTIPIVTRTGGLADSVTDASAGNLQRGTASGVTIAAAEPSAILGGVERALDLRPRWPALQRAGMQRDFSWGVAARRYAELYRSAGH